MYLREGVCVRAFLKVLSREGVCVRASEGVELRGRLRACVF